MDVNTGPDGPAGEATHGHDPHLTAIPDVPHDKDHLPPRALAYVLAVFTGGLACLVGFGPGLDTSDPWGFALIGLLAVAAGRTRISVYGDTATSVGMVGDFAVAFLFGPAGAVIVSPFAALATDLGKAPWYKLLFNIGLFTITNASVALVAWGIMGGELRVDAWLIPVALLAVVLYYALSNSLLALAVSLSTERSVVQVWRDQFEWQIPHFAVLGLLGVAVAVAYEALGLVGVLAFIAPPLMMRLSTKQYIDKTSDNVEELRKTNRELRYANTEILQMAEQLRQTYDGTLEALVSALDARDRETKGHSIRVAKYMMEVAARVGVQPDTDEWVDMQRGALLHDVGKIGVSDTILHKPGPLTDEEWEHMRKHPKIGFDMLRDISFLSGAAAIVMAHHERWDGKGYPHGLQGEDIPLGSRIFVIADTFDAMTSDRPYRAALSFEDSKAEIVRCAGTQFDPRCVQAFLEAFDRVCEIRRLCQETVTEHHAAAAPAKAA